MEYFIFIILLNVEAKARISSRSSSTTYELEADWSVMNPVSEQMMRGKVVSVIAVQGRDIKRHESQREQEALDSFLHGSLSSPYSLLNFPVVWLRANSTHARKKVLGGAPSATGNIAQVEQVERPGRPRASPGSRSLEGPQHRGIAA